jgi:hypothetical protein
MSRQCERPDCAEPATVAYRFDARERIVFFDHLREGDPLAAGALCQRHAQVMVLPRGWWLDDRRIPVPTLFAATAPPLAEKAPRVRARRAPSPPAAETVAETELPLTNGDAPPSWTPEFDPGDDLNGLLDAKTRLLARAFRSVPMNEVPMNEVPLNEVPVNRPGNGRSPTS